MPHHLSRVRGLTAALLAALALLIGGAALMASGADHRDSPAAEGNAPLDLTDVYAFRSPANNDNLVVAFGVNGVTTPDKNATTRFSATGKYLVHVSNDADLEDEATVTVDFDDATPQGYTITGLGANPITGTVTAAGETPRITDAGGVKSFAGLRDDPFFFDFVAFKKFYAGPYVPEQGLRAPGDGAPSDLFAGTNVTYVVIEVPITALTGLSASNTGKIQAWASTDTGSGQLDRMGIPAINTALIPSAMKDDFNKGNPATDETAFRPTGKATIDTLRAAVDAVLNGPVGPEDNGPLGNLTSDQVATALIPDIVTIDFSKPVVFPNGRQLTDDVIDTALQLVLNRTVGITDKIDANDKTFATSFPYLAEPFIPAAQPSAPVQTGGRPGTDDGVSTTTAAAFALAGALMVLAGATLVFARRETN